MNIEKVIFAFFILLALTLNFGFFYGDVDVVDHHNIYELFAAIIVSLIATVMKFGDRTHMGAILLATSLVADLQLIIAAVIWALMGNVGEVNPEHLSIASVVSMSGGALLANITSVVLLVIETVTLRK